MRGWRRHAYQVLGRAGAFLRYWMSVNRRRHLCAGHLFCEGGVADKKPCEAMLGKSCPQGTSVAFGKSCEPGTFCTGGSAEPAPCTAAPGFYCGVESSDPAGSPCPMGYAARDSP